MDRKEEPSDAFMRWLGVDKYTNRKKRNHTSVGRGHAWTIEQLAQYEAGWTGELIKYRTILTQV